ncbi:head-tail adaptor protein [Algoriphagus sp. AK58]|uniref:head-tail adaptor protein n=1 Tax=Algoriphagus sp. AK58 TaxID=1406877 RepID=UPI00164F8388|nr:head-tail adaptor protein [Algoriphagus sp. AK58]MBC6365794.1 hypothetical protein [Algoriphagus sp. AK58]
MYIRLEDSRYLIKVNKLTKTKDKFGHEKESYSYYASFWASKYEWQNREIFEGKNLIDSNIFIFKIYYDPNITTDDQIEFEEKTFKITGIKELGYKEGLEITSQYKSNK